jgi:signal peptidase I
MPAKWHKYSYTAQIQERRTFFSFILLLALLALIITLVYAHLVTMYLVESPTMEPSLSPGDCIIATPLYNHETEEAKGISLRITAKRGDLAVLDPEYRNDLNIMTRSVNALVSFITFRRIVPFSATITGGERQTIRRIIAFPGDSLYIENSIAHVKTAGSSHYLTEFELASQAYDIRVDELPPGWPKELPFSGTLGEVTLGPDEFFVLADNRSTSSDSRTWGPVHADRIRSKVVLRYWPFPRFGKP